MSSLRNAVKRRTHKERSQAAERRKYQRRPKDDDDDGRRKYKPRGQPAYGVAPSYGGYAQTNVVR